MKIGIATVHDSSNHGSFLQAYALQQFLLSQGHNVFFIRTRDKKYIKRLYYPPIKNILRNPVKYIKQYKFGNIKHHVFFKDQNCFKEIDQAQVDNMDLIILGSDEIWNVRTPIFRLPIFYGGNFKPRIITYAVSVGNSSYDDIVKYQTVTEAIKQMKYILARDNNTAVTCEKITGVKPEIVCDPTMLIDSNCFKRPLTDEFKMSDEYIAVYSYDHMLNDNTSRIIRQYADKNNLKIVSVGFYNSHADKNIICGPLDFFNVLNSAKYIITSTFHGTIFSILNHKKFISIAYSIKTIDLLQQLDLNECIISNKDITEEILHKRFNYNSTFDYDIVDAKIELLRKKSIDLLNESIRGTL